MFVVIINYRPIIMTIAIAIDVALATGHLRLAPAVLVAAQVPDIQWKPTWQNIFQYFENDFQFISQTCE